MSFAKDDLSAVPTTGPFIVEVTIVARNEDSAKEIVRYITEISKVALSDKEPGTTTYRLSRGVHDSNYLNIYEAYTGLEAFEVHRQNPVLKEFLAAVPGLASEVFPKFYRDLWPQ
ncbi:hypothetical protein IE81DRAFT_349338 [Ceraceosorus guamensis]|uniref:ABM domain-containing protein n=1 Tax=Ceraceosorus guamensis TaxID=1522189 RepID=A0A316VY11_9BASI|nr:hypothetical protein IE81DRAFT_349338 [Ceraceosorus guamensis]PWN40365.1 hypothetical protein IE81DRAFT_349338 [Ceraceosorus guamensis]